MKVFFHSEQPRKSTLQPVSDQVDVWIVDFNKPWLMHSELNRLLTSEEMVRAERYALEQPRRQFCITRACLRQLLGSYLRCAARDVPLTVTASGKPVLKNGEIHFSVSHSDEAGIIVVANRQLGVDVESLRHMTNAHSLVQRFFNPQELSQFNSLPSALQMTAFFRGWTAKESLLKAVGVGLAKLESCIVDLDPRNASRVLSFEGRTESEWKLHHWSVAGNAVACLAIESETELQIEAAGDYPGRA